MVGNTLAKRIAAGWRLLKTLATILLLAPVPIYATTISFPGWAITGQPADITATIQNSGNGNIDNQILFTVTNAIATPETIVLVSAGSWSTNPVGDSVTPQPVTNFSQAGAGSSLTVSMPALFLGPGRTQPAYSSTATPSNNQFAEIPSRFGSSPASVTVSLTLNNVSSSSFTLTILPN